jgi:hypothetical protein
MTERATAKNEFGLTSRIVSRLPTGSDGTPVRRESGNNQLCETDLLRQLWSFFCFSD